MKNKLEVIRRIEERLTYANPTESARLTKKLVKLKQEWIEE